MSKEDVHGYQYWKITYDTRVGLRVTRVQICTRDAIIDTRVQHTSCIYKESHTEFDISKGKNYNQLNG